MKRIAIRTALIAIVIGAWALVLAPDTAEREADPYASARYACREFISEQMHDPRSADWGHWSAWPASHEGDRYIVKASFHGSNLLGATVHNEVRCELRRDGETWFRLAMTQG